MTPPASTRRRDALANSERLIAAARKVFASGGQGSLEEIASEAGVGIATLYRHFSGRESLTRAVYRSIMRDELLPLLRQSCAQGSARQSFLLIVERLLELLDRERGLIASSADFAVLTDDLLREFLEPFAVLLGGEGVTWRLLVGGSMVLAAMLAVELAPRRKIEGEVTHLTV